PEDAEELIEAPAERLLEGHRLGAVLSYGVLRHPTGDDATDDRSDHDGRNPVEEQGGHIHVQGACGWRSRDEPASRVERPEHRVRQDGSDRTGDEREEKEDDEEVQEI